MLPFTRLIRALPPTVPFVPPEALERQQGQPLVLRVGANESNFGISPKAQQAMIAAVEHVHWYNDPEGYELRSALAARHQVAREEVALGAGIDELLGLLVRLFAEPGDAVVTSLGAYPTFNYHVAGHGAVLHTVPYRADREDLPALLAKARQVRPKLLYVANPDNPMGTYQRADEVRDCIAHLPPGCVLLLDEAYMDFAPADAQWPVDAEQASVVRLRTFSKAHGMAGARVGYALAHRDLVAALDKVRNHFGVNRIAQAGALASLGDDEFVQQVVRQVAAGRREYEVLAAELGLHTVPSATNFVALDVGNGQRARQLMQVLLQRGVFVRMPGVAPLDRCIRLTVGPAAERQALAEVLRDVLPHL